MAGVLTAKTCAATARRGARLMDKVRKGWFWDIRVTKLDLSSGCACVLGQLYGRYENAKVNELTGIGVPDHDIWQYGNSTKIENAARKYGFLARRDQEDVDYPLLTQAWANEVRTRRGFKAIPLTNPSDGKILVGV